MVEDVQQAMLSRPERCAPGGPDVMWRSDLRAGRTVVNKDVLHDDPASLASSGSVIVQNVQVDDNKVGTTLLIM
jgi:hypothetical protein